ncbi:cpii coat sec24 protein [Phaffia rhodozyma]|uniref:Cpii coat sec24 protein n=1 Tax=Phaffia rhodozyma TaxID=264483 RepID=A0A0F7SHF1_PHARH|nr:cpii coat sec24 protein [Phaffia rhodozyma]
MSAVALPAGWSEERTDDGTPYYISPQGQSQWDPPAFEPAVIQPGFQQQKYPQAPAQNTNTKRRQYASEQAQAYIQPTGGDPSLGPVSGSAGGDQLYTPGFGVESATGAAAGQAYYDPAAAGGGQGYGQQGAGQSGAGWAQGGAGPGVGQLANQFGNMGIASELKYPLETVNLVGLRPDVTNIEEAPPAIRLPPGASLTPSPDAIPDYSYMRSTLNAVPTTNSLLNKSKLPFALVISPHRSLKEHDPRIPVVKDTVIARCRRCRAYIHPYVTYIEGGHRWKCPLCNLSNEVPQQFDYDEKKNENVDRWARKELNYSVVDFVAPTEYMVRAPQPPCYVFLIDVSANAVKSGMVATAARTILESLDRLPNEDGRTRAGIIAVDSSLHFFSLPAGESDPAMLVMSDLEDVFLPKPSDLLVNVKESRKALENVLGGLNDIFKDTMEPANAVGAGLQAAYKLISSIGGKIVTLTSTLPTLGPGALKHREDPKLLGTSKESTLLQSAGSWYKTFAIDCSRAQVSVDMFLFSATYTDIASLSCLPKYTGGQTYFYPAFNAAKSEDAIKFSYELGEVLASQICLEAVIRVRASRGLRMKAFHGNFFVRSTDLLSLPAVPVDQSYAIEVELEDNVSTPTVCMQTAVLHTTCYGERRIRVITLCLPTTDNVSNIFASADQAAIATLLANKAVEKTVVSSLQDARDYINKQLFDFLVAFKAATQAGGSTASTSLMLPANLRFLPLILLGLLKNVGIRESNQIPPDMRSYAQALLSTMPTQLLIPYLHPKFYALHTMSDEAGTVGENGVILPETLNLTSERLERHGLFLIEDGQNIFLYIGRDAVPQLVQDVFDAPTYQELRGGKTTLPLLENQFSQRVNAIINTTREMRRSPYRPHLYVVKEDGEPALRAWALSALIEDRSDKTPSYHQFVSSLRDKVNASS